MLDTAQLRAMTPQDLAILGANEVAYIRPAMVRGKQVFAIMAGDGRQLGVAPDFTSAISMVFNNQKDIVSVH